VKDVQKTARPAKAALIAALPVLLVPVVAWSASTLDPRLGPGLNLAFTGALFLGLTIVGLGLLRCIEAPSTRTLFRQPGRIAASWFAFVLILRLQGHGSLSLTSAGLGIFVAATAEEIVFRLVIPGALWRTVATHAYTRFAQYAAILTAQLAFAAAHVMRGNPSPLHPLYIEAFRLTVAGMLYFVIVQRAGLWLGAGAHAALNADQFFSTPFDGMLYPALLFSAIVAIVAIYYAPVTLGVNTGFSQYGSINPFKGDRCRMRNE
jgi:multisubunit Na+/H+ antiporter MnhE subunit